MQRRLFLATSLAAAAAGRAVSAQTLTKEVRFYNGFPPGGTSDLLGRFLAEGFKSFVSQPVVVEMPGMGSVPPGVELVRPSRDARTSAFAAELHELRKHKGLGAEEARERVLDPLIFAGFLLRAGDCDGAVAGSESATAAS